LDRAAPHARDPQERNVPLDIERKAHVDLDPDGAADLGEGGTAVIAPPRGAIEAVGVAALPNRAAAAVISTAQGLIEIGGIAALPNRAAAAARGRSAASAGRSPRTGGRRLGRDLRAMAVEAAPARQLTGLSAIAAPA
jgi:hypothetical protein